MSDSTTEKHGVEVWEKVALMSRQLLSDAESGKSTPSASVVVMARQALKDAEGIIKSQLPSNGSVR